MCEKQIESRHGQIFLNKVPAPGRSSSRRRRLWELTYDCHCPVVGVCMPLATLRKLLNKALGYQLNGRDYDLHVATVAKCTQRNTISEALQHQLEQRYAATIKRFALAKSVQTLEQLWLEAVDKGDVAGAFWAGLTHACCNAELQETMCRDIHMIQHQAGAHVRADLAKYEAMSRKYAELALAYERLQERSTRLAGEKSAEINQLGAQLMKMQAQAIGKDTLIASLQAELSELQASLPDLASRLQLKEKNAQLASRQHILKSELHELNLELARMRLLTAEPKSLMPDDGCRQTFQMDQEQAHANSHCLHEKTVLCVGGRTGSIGAYKLLTERVGGRFAHHDGGLEDKPGLLDANLAAADVVICQVGCIGHNAYWRVKDFCKRTGKRCVFIDNPSTSSFARGLQKIVIKAGETPLGVADTKSDQC
jgi:hypothetical protein